MGTCAGQPNADTPRSAWRQSSANVFHVKQGHAGMDRVPPGVVRVDVTAHRVPHLGVVLRVPPPRRDAVHLAVAPAEADTLADRDVDAYAGEPLLLTRRREDLGVKTASVSDISR
ncbi:hypothetical protein GCM10010313_48380 [Streptomyces violarus]|nr:hypothetical protein GCM10010313_48380 [Streptomyces violarus]